MPKFIVNAEFGITTEVDADFYTGAFGDGDADDYEDSSYFGSQSVDAEGGSITFTVEAEDEREAERKAEEFISDGMEAEDNNGLTWQIRDVSFSIEKDEMSRDEAFAIVRRLLDRLTTEGVITSEEREALDLVIQDA